MNAGIFALTMAMAPAAVPPAPPMPVSSPFLFVKMVAPKGVTTTWYPGTKAAVTGDIPVGLRGLLLSPGTRKSSRTSQHADLSVDRGSRQLDDSRST